MFEAHISVVLIDSKCAIEIPADSKLDVVINLSSDEWNSSNTLEFAIYYEQNFGTKKIWRTHLLSSNMKFLLIIKKKFKENVHNCPP